jgi:simple sugar transport system substrate-binding protein
VKLPSSKRFQRTSALVAIAFCATIVLAPGSSALSKATTTATKIKIAFVSGPLNDPFFPPLIRGAQDAAKLLRAQLNYIPIDEGDFQASSAKTMQAAIAMKPDVIVVGDFLPSVVDPLIKQAIAAGIPVFVNQSGQDSWEAVGALGFIGQTGPDVGVTSAKEFLAAGKKDILCINNVAGNPYLDAACKGLADGMAAGGGTAKMITLPSGDGTDLTKSTADIGGYLNTNKGVDGIMTLNNLTALAAVAALKPLNKIGKVAVSTLGLSKQALADVKAGNMLFAINEQPYLDGYLGVLFAYNYVKYGLAPIGFVKTGPQVINKANVAKITSVLLKYPNVIGPK